MKFLKDRHQKDCEPDKERKCEEKRWVSAEKGVRFGLMSCVILRGK